MRLFPGQEKRAWEGHPSAASKAHWEGQVNTDIAHSVFETMLGNRLNVTCANKQTKTKTKPKQFQKFYVQKHKIPRHSYDLRSIKMCPELICICA